MTQVADKLQPWLAALEAAAARRLALAAGSARPRGVALRRARVPDGARRGVAVHERGADRLDRVPAGAGDAARAPRPSTRSSTPTRRFRLVIVNGRFAPELSRTAGLPAGVRVGSLAAAVDRAGRRRRPLSRPARRLRRARVRGAEHRLRDDGAYVYIPDGVVLEQPLQLLFVSTGDGVRPIMSHPRALIVAGDRSQVAHRRDLRQRAGREALHQRRDRDLSPARARSIDHYKVQQESVDAFHIASMHIHASRSEQRLVPLVLARRQPGAQRRHRAPRRRRRRVHAERPVSRRRRPAGRQAHDDRSRQAALPEPRGLQGHPRRQRARRCSTARSSCARTRRRPTPSRPTARCCSRTTRPINTKPQLEIFADDVKCTHGAAIGQLDEDALFYLRARGLTYRRGARHADSRVRRRDPRSGARSSRCEVALEGELYAQLAQRSRGGGRGMTPVGRAGAQHRFDVARVRRGLPDPGGARARQAARLSRQREHEPEAAGRCSTRWTRTTGTATRTSIAATHLLSERATALYEGARAKAARLHQRAGRAVDRLHRRGPPTASTSSRRATAARRSRPGDEVVISWLEHHSNIVPWQLLCEQTGAVLRVVPIDDRGEIDLDGLRGAAVAADEARRA